MSQNDINMSVSGEFPKEKEDSMLKLSQEFFLKKENLGDHK